MKSSLRTGRTPHFVTLFSVLLFSFLAPPTNVYAAQMVSDIGLSPGDWKSILTNGQGQDACWLKEWLASSECRKGRGDEDKNTDENTRHALAPRDDLSPSACKCTVPYFNILCGCLLSNGSSSLIPNINYTRWKEDCEGSGFPANRRTSWLDNQGQDIPAWAFIAPNGLTFDSARVLRVTDHSKRWSTIQIITPIVTFISTLALLGIMYLFLYRRQRCRAKFQHGSAFFAFIRKILIPPSQSVRHPGRNDTWQIDDHGRERFASDSESFIMVPNGPSLVVESPVEETSYWSPATDIRQPPRLNQNIDHRVPYTSTMRNIRSRVKNLMPWTVHPHPVTNIRPGSRYRIDGDQSSVKTRSNTLSSLSTSRKYGGNYRTIREEDDEYTQMMDRAGGASTAEHGQGARAEVTARDLDAVAESVILIGDRDFTLESGSTGQHGSLPRLSTKNSPSVAYARGHGIEGTLKSPESTHPDVRVESPSPTMDLHSARAIPISPGAPPLLPPLPQERPPLPPIMERITPRRTPSPHPQTLPELDGRNVSKNNLNGEGDTRYQGDPSASPGTNALSYATISYEPRSHPQPSLDNSRNAGAHLTTVPNHRRDNSFSHRRRSGSGSRPLPSSQAELLVSPPALPHLHSNMSLDKISVSRTTNINERSVHPSGYLPQPQDGFDPYEGIPHPHAPQPDHLSDVDMVNIRQRHNHTSSVSLPRSPGEPEGQLQRGWSADDEMDRASLLIDQRPMQIDNGMNGVYIATPQDVKRIGKPGEGPPHWRNPSAESFATVVSNASAVERLGGGGRGESGRPVRFDPESPTLSMLEKDLGNRSGFATYAGSESVGGNSGWDASTQSHGTGGISQPISRPPPQPTSSNQQPSPPSISVTSRDIETLGHSHHGFSNHSFSSVSSAGPSVSPSPGHIRRGSDTNSNDPSRSQNRSRENILSPPMNDPLRLFPDSVRAAGYTIGLGPHAVPVPPRSPRLNEFRNINADANTSVIDDTHNKFEGAGACDDAADGQHRSRANSRVTGSGPLPGYVERDRTQQSGGGTWGTESSGVQTIFEAIQQLPEPLNAQRERTAAPLGTEPRTRPE